jgi:type I restriction enzyme S subunit
MADEWIVRPLEDCVAALIDYRGKTPQKTLSGIPLITAKVVKGGRIETPDEFISVDDYEAWMRRGIPNAGDVVITTEAPLGEVAQLGSERVALAQRLIALRGRPGVLDNTFFKFLLQSEGVQDQLRARASGTTVLGIKQSELRKVMLALPTVDEQRAIAHILGTLDDKIELNRRINETLEAMARALFKSWFVDFDPVRAKSEGRDPGLPQPLADLFPDSFEDSKLGEIPAGWTRVDLGSWVEVLSGGTPSRTNPSLWGGDIPWISPKVMTAIHADEADEYVTQEAIGNGTRLTQSGSVLVMVRGMGLHQHVRVSQARKEVAFNQDVKAMVPLSIQPTLLLFALLDAQPDLLQRVESSGHGTGKLPTEVLLARPITMPDRDTQSRLAKVFDVMNDRIGIARRESRTLAALRDTLLPKLISGELLVKDTERFIGRAV